MSETILQSLKRVEDIIYSLPYDDLSEYLQGVRDVINMINGEEYSQEVADVIIENFEAKKTEIEKASILNRIKLRCSYRYSEKDKDIYSCAMTYNGKTVYFEHSSACSKKPTVKDVLFDFCSNNTSSDNLEDFYNDFYSGEDKEEVKRIFERCQSQTKKLHTLFSKEEIHQIEDLVL